MLRIPQTSEFLLNSDKFEFSWILMRILMRILIRIRFEWFDRSPTEPFNLGPPPPASGSRGRWPRPSRRPQSNLQSFLCASGVKRPEWRNTFSVAPLNLEERTLPFVRDRFAWRRNLFSDFQIFLDFSRPFFTNRRCCEESIMNSSMLRSNWKNDGPHPFRIPRFRLSTPKLCFQADNLIAGNLIAGNLQVWLQCAQRYSIRGMLCRKRKAADADSADQVDQFHQKEFELPPGYKGQEDVGHANGYDPAKYTEQQLRGVACEAWFKYFGRRRRWSFPRFPKETERFYYFYACHYYLLNYHWWQYEYEPQEPTALPLKNAKMLTN